MSQMTPRTRSSRSTQARVEISPAITAFTRSGPPRNGTNSAARPSDRNIPFSAATMNGPASA